MKCIMSDCKKEASGCIKVKSILANTEKIEAFRFYCREHYFTKYEKERESMKRKYQMTINRLIHELYQKKNGRKTRK